MDLQQNPALVTRGREFENRLEGLLGSYEARKRIRLRVSLRTMTFMQRPRPVDMRQRRPPGAR